MLQNAFDVGRLFGVRIRLNWSVSVIFALIVFHLAVGVFPFWHPDWSAALLLGVALGAALVFFVSLLLHELAHALTARGYGLPVGSITLFLFGGVSDIEQDPETPGVEAVIAGVGPLTSAVIGFIFLFIFSQIQPELAGESDTALGLAATMGPVATILAWAGPINLLLALFNLLPAFPLDGGRLLRALFWWSTDNLSRATRWAASVSRALAVGIMLLGVLMAFGLYIPYLGGGPVSGLWLLFIGWFLMQAATGTYTRRVISDGLEDVDVGRLTDPDILTVRPETTIEELVEELASTRPQEIFPIADDEGIRGGVDIEDLRGISSAKWEHTRVTYAMTPVDKLFTVPPDTSADAALTEMVKRGLEELIVVRDGEVLGLLHRDNILRWVRMHSRNRQLKPRRA